MAVFSTMAGSVSVSVTSIGDYIFSPFKCSCGGSINVSFNMSGPFLAMQLVRIAVGHREALANYKISLSLVDRLNPEEIAKELVTSMMLQLRHIGSECEGVWQEALDLLS